MIIRWRPRKIVRIVIIGGGAIGDKIAQAIASIGGNVKLVAVQCRDEEKARLFSLAHKCEAYSDYEEMLDSESPDLAVICTPSGAHLEPALAAIRRKINVLIEKPIEITADRVQQIIDEAEKYGVVARGIFQKRYSKPYIRLREALRDGRFGGQDDVEFGLTVPWYRLMSYFYTDKGCTTRNWKGTSELDGGGAAMNQGIHGVDQLIDLMSMLIDNNPVGGQSIATIDRAIAGNLTPGVSNMTHDFIEMEDHISCRMTGWAGSHASFYSSTWLLPEFDQTLVVTGCGEKVVLLEDVPTVWKFEHSRKAYDGEIRCSISGAGSKNSAGRHPMAIGTGQHADCLLDTIKEIHGLKPVFDLSARQTGLPVLAILAMYESARTGRPVQVSDLVA